MATVAATGNDLIVTLQDTTRTIYSTTLQVSRRRCCPGQFPRLMSAMCYSSQALPLPHVRHWPDYPPVFLRIIHVNLLFAVSVVQGLPRISQVVDADPLALVTLDPGTMFRILLPDQPILNATSVLTDQHLNCSHQNVVRGYHLICKARATFTITAARRSIDLMYRMYRLQTAFTVWLHVYLKLSSASRVAGTCQNRIKAGLQRRNVSRRQCGLHAALLRFYNVVGYTRMRHAP